MIAAGLLPRRGALPARRSWAPVPAGNSPCQARPHGHVLGAGQERAWRGEGRNIAADLCQRYVLARAAPGFDGRREDRLTRVSWEMAAVGVCAGFRRERARGSVGALGGGSI